MKKIKTDSNKELKFRPEINNFSKMLVKTVDKEEQIRNKNLKKNN